MRTVTRRIAVALAVVFVSGLLAGCGERAQVIAYKSGKYQGKPDGKPYENEPGAALYTTSKWTGGDKASWESAMRTRAQGQNEYSRTE
jgi:hypothetical protein